MRRDRRAASSVDRLATPARSSLAALRTRIDRHNASVAQVRSQETAHNSVVALYNTDCAKKYYRDDMEAARTRLGISAAAQ